MFQKGERENERTNEFFINEGNEINTILFFIQPSVRDRQDRQTEKERLHVPPEPFQYTLGETCLTKLLKDGKRRQGQDQKIKRNFGSVRLCCLMSSDVGWHIRDKLRPMPKHCSILLYVHGNHKAR